ncbi:hypothetical protein EUX98_g3118 [Antrodiella citrinella]|uniref:Rab-GAP TBC domain-containing protein n=1 Tax=Antrodiella citrinella TaxID=2447956 RepID=A0A4S4MXC7_9APHY|nr:hypothetical protein EUX98_g3118 [Antrodiella citrinella]
MDSLENSSILWNDLRELSVRPGGFGTRRVSLWLQLLRVSPSILPPPESDLTPTQPEHQDERQIRLDTDRSFVLYPHALHDLVVSVFRRRPALSYFQGYHDIVSVLFLTLPPEVQLVCAEKLSLQRVRDSMGATLEPVVGLLHVLRRVLTLADPEFAALMIKTSPLPYFALSSILTLFSHDIPTLPLIQHIFDYLLCRPPVHVVYLAAALALSRKEEAVALEQEGEDGMIHQILSGLPDLFEEGDEEIREDTDDEVNGEAENVSKAGSGADAEVHANNEGARLSEMVEHDTGLSAHDLDSDSRAVTPPSPLALHDNDETPIHEEASVSHDASLPDHPDSASRAASSPLVIHDNELHVQEEASGSHDAPPSDDHSPHTTDQPHAAEVALDSSTVSRPPSCSPTPPIPASSPPSRSPSPTPSSSSSAPPRPRVSLSHLMRAADSLYAVYPPTHPSIALREIMGPQSVVFTWSETADDLPEDDEAERMVLRPDLIVQPLPALLHEDDRKKEDDEAEERDTASEDGEKDVQKQGREKRSRRRLRKPLPLAIRRKAMVASAVLVLGVAMAVYGSGGFHRGGLMDRHRHGGGVGAREWKTFGHFVGAIVVGAAERFLDSVWG